MECFTGWLVLCRAHIVNHSPAWLFCVDQFYNPVFLGTVSGAIIVGFLRGGVQGEGVTGEP